MDKIRMSIEILNIIHAVLDYRRFICSHNMITKEDGFDAFAETEKYYKTLPLPKELHHNRADFEKILSYTNQQDKLDRLDNTAYSDLHYDEF